MPNGSNLIIGQSNTGTATTQLQLSGGTATVAFVVANDAGGNAIVGNTAFGDGVAGSSNQGIGVEGVGVIGVLGAGATGVFGITSEDDSAGVFGSAGGDSAGVWGQVSGGSGTWPGVEGWSATGNGVRGVSVAEGGAANGVVGFSESGIGVVGLTDSPSSFGGVFFGGLVVASGPKSSAVRHPDGSYRLLHCMESPESWFEDFGRAALARGKLRLSWIQALPP